MRINEDLKMNKKVVLVSGSILVVFTVFLWLIVSQVPPGLFVGYDIAVQGDYAYVSDNEGVDIIDVANPRNPTRIVKVAPIRIP